MHYAASRSLVLLKLRIPSFMQGGADLGFLSAFPDEAEVLYPPLTYLQPKTPGKSTTFSVRGAKFTVVEVVPHLGS